MLHTYFDHQINFKTNFYFSYMHAIILIEDSQVPSTFPYPSRGRRATPLMLFIGRF